ncbi:Clavaminate synthase-like protein [Hypoxylon sp. FL0543]|nr:Clavaminate synthase-like protein [Hypoxylon sp. FL0543]
MTTHLLPLAPESLAGLQVRVRREEHGLAAEIFPRLQSSNSQPPRHFPNLVEGPETWSGFDSDDSDKSKVPTIVLNDFGIAEVKKGLQDFYALELDGDEVNQERFPLPSLQSQLDQYALEVHRGGGICIIRGLNPKWFSIEDNIIILLGLAGYIGDQRGVQNSKGDMLSHVTESKSWTVPQDRRHGIHTNSSLPFHTDMGCEILAMQVRDRAEAGGYTCVAPMAVIYNDLMQSNPWVLHALARDNWPIQTSSRNDTPFVLCPLLEYQADRLVISMDPARIGPHPRARNGSIPQLTLEQQEALAELQRVARKHQVRLETQPGDIVFINNLALLHARESYQDSDSSSRHLVRLWLRNTRLGWLIPSSMKMPWDAAFGEKAKKIINRNYPIMPMPEYMECKYSNGTAAFVPDGDSEDDIMDGVSPEDDTQLRSSSGS